MTAPRNAGEKPTERIKGNFTGCTMSHPNTVNFTECLEMPLRVQNFGGNFQMSTIGRIANCKQLKSYIAAANIYADI